MIPRRIWTPKDGLTWLRMILHRGLTRAQLKVAEYLLWYRGRFGMITPARLQIATATGVSERTVTRAVAELERIRALTVYRDRPYKNDAGRFTRQRTNLYVTKFPPKHANAQVVPTGHSCPVSAPMVAVEPLGSSDERPANLFDAGVPSSEPESAAVTGLPWVALGISRADWLASFRS